MSVRLSCLWLLCEWCRAHPAPHRASSVCLCCSCSRGLLRTSARPGRRRVCPSRLAWLPPLHVRTSRCSASLFHAPFPSHSLHTFLAFPHSHFPSPLLSLCTFLAFFYSTLPFAHFQQFAHFTIRSSHLALCLARHPALFPSSIHSASSSSSLFLACPSCASSSSSAFTHCAHSPSSVTSCAWCVWRAVQSSATSCST